MLRVVSLGFIILPELVKLIIRCVIERNVKVDVKMSSVYRHHTRVVVLIWRMSLCRCARKVVRDGIRVYFWSLIFIKACFFSCFLNVMGRGKPPPHTYPLYIFFVLKTAMIMYAEKCIST